MRKGILIIGIIIIVVLAFMLFKVEDSKQIQQELIEKDISISEPEIMSDLTLSSSSFQNSEAIPSQYTCDGKNINPPLSISGVPSGTQSLVLIMDDPDAVKPAGHVWDHWVVFNIQPTINNIQEGEEPEGTPGITSSGVLKYGGPCPPDGEHLYFFKLYALDSMLELDEGVTKKDVEDAMQDHVIEETQLTGTYIRQ